jgi:hypothetical protein
MPRFSKLFLLAASFVCLSTAAAAPSTADHLIFVMTDGLRWQEVFHGADPALLNKESGGVEDLDAVRRNYWRDSSDARRRALMPFVWTTIAHEGQLYGNRDKHSEAFVTNGLNFSYPGYSEALCGFADPRVKSNDKIINPNQTVLTWLNRRPKFAGKVASFAAWDVMPYVLNAKDAGYPVNAGYEPFTLLPDSRTVSLLNTLKADSPRYWEEEPFDNLPFHTALEYLQTKRPRVLYLSLGETDDWAHDGRYDLYLDAAHRADAYLRQIWEAAQAMPEFRGKTALVFATDHGRGSSPAGWKTHGEKEPDSKYVWMMFLGPGTPALGERTGGTVTQTQIAATLAALLSEDYQREVTKAAQPIRQVLGVSRRQ